MQLRHHALEVLCLCNPQEKAQAAMAMLAQAHRYAIAPQAVLHCHAPLPGHPARPVLRPHTQVARRSPATLQGRASLCALAAMSLWATRPCCMAARLAMNR